MTAVSEQMYPVICKYCANCQGKKCLADVPWYCCSIRCKYCRKFMNTGKKPNPHQCLTYKCSIYDAENCKRTYRIRKNMEVENA